MGVVDGMTAAYFHVALYSANASKPDHTAKNRDQTDEQICKGTVAVLHDSQKLQQ